MMLLTLGLSGLLLRSLKDSNIVQLRKEGRMERLGQSKLASSLLVLAGIWTMTSPLFISMTGASLVSILITGAIMIVFGFVQLAWENSLPSWINALAAVWLFISAFIFTMSAAATWSQIITAAIAFVLSTWDGVEMGEVQRMHHTHAV